MLGGAPASVRLTASLCAVASHVQAATGRSPNGPEASFPASSSLAVRQFCAGGLHRLAEHFAGLGDKRLAGLVCVHALGNELPAERFFAGARTGGDSSFGLVGYAEQRGQQVMTLLQEACFCGHSFQRGPSTFYATTFMRGRVAIWSILDMFERRRDASEPPSPAAAPASEDAAADDTMTSEQRRIAEQQASLR
jgi:hypothetical protein